jgi:patatin-like phospholipase/acyl hydrolase
MCVTETSTGPIACWRSMAVGSAVSSRWLLERLEALVQQRTGQALWQYFDYIAGTSTGAIFAAGLARGFFHR